MLYNFDWLDSGELFPPTAEEVRIRRYKQNELLFDGDHFSDPIFRTRVKGDVSMPIYRKCAERITRIVGNWDDVISFPVLLNYQRLLSLKMADLVCGEPPTVSGGTFEENTVISEVRDYTEFDSKMYSTVLDISRYGDAIWRMYIDESGKGTFTCWDPKQWYPVVAQDGTNTILYHCLCWRENISTDELNPDWRLHVQIHGTQLADIGEYEAREYKMHRDGHTIKKLVSTETVKTGFLACAVIHLKAYTTTNSVYGYDDYIPIDSLLAEIMVRIGQISAILDKHADPNITGPVSMLQVDPVSGEYKLQLGKFFAVSPGEEQPRYMTWDGQLSSAFKQLEFLINQMYILSEMGSALLGAKDGSSQAISGTAMRFKMVNPLAKARRITNSLSKPVRTLFSSLSRYVGNISDLETMPELPVSVRHISVFWSDGLPDDPRENIEVAKLATGETKMMPLEVAIMEYFGRSNAEARDWIEQLKAQTAEPIPEVDNPNHPGPQDGTGVNPQAKGSELGLTNFTGLNN